MRSFIKNPRNHTEPKQISYIFSLQLLICIYINNYVIWLIIFSNDRTSMHLCCIKVASIFFSLSSSLCSAAIPNRNPQTFFRSVSWWSHSGGRRFSSMPWVVSPLSLFLVYFVLWRRERWRGGFEGFVCGREDSDLAPACLCGGGSVSYRSCSCNFRPINELLIQIECLLEFGSVAMVFLGSVSFLSRSQRPPPSPFLGTLLCLVVGFCWAKSVVLGCSGDLLGCFPSASQSFVYGFCFLPLVFLLCWFTLG